MDESLGYINDQPRTIVGWENMDPNKTQPQQESIDEASSDSTVEKFLLRSVKMTCTKAKKTFILGA